VFRSRLRLESQVAYAELAEETEVAARAMPGFIDFKTFAADDGERVSLVTFASPSTHQAWRDERLHRRAQQQGRDEYFAEYSIQVGECTHTTHWERPRS
jgi:heme-degrading monooxygenase HmoA